MTDDPKKFRYDQQSAGHKNPPAGLQPVIVSTPAPAPTVTKALTKEQTERRKRLLAEMTKTIEMEERANTSSETPTPTPNSKNLPFDLEMEHPAGKEVVMAEQEQKLEKAEDSTISKYRISLSQALETPEMKSIRYGVIGTGQCGGRLAEVFARFGYPACVINTAQQDLAFLNIPDENKLFMPYALGGAGKNLLVGQQAATDNQEQIKELLNRTLVEIDQVLICVGGGGGCIAEDAQVFTSYSGLTKFSNLYSKFVQDESLPEQMIEGGTSIDVSDLKIKTISLNAKTGKFEKDQILEISKHYVPLADRCLVKMENGTEVVTSSWHKFFVFEKGEIVEKKATELRVKNVVFSPMIEWPFVENQKMGKYEYTPDLCWLIGLALGDGSFVDSTVRSFRIYSDCEKTLIRAKEVIKNIFNVESHIHLMKTGSYYELATGVRGVVEELRLLCELSSYGAKSAIIKIPSAITLSSRESVIAFIAGYFDADGWIVEKYACFSSISEEMIDQMVMLLQLLGFAATKSFSDSKKYELYGRDATNWKISYIARIASGLYDFANQCSPQITNTKRLDRLNQIKGTNRAPRRAIYVDRDWLLSTLLDLGLNFKIKDRTIEKNGIRVSLHDFVNNRVESLIISKIEDLGKLVEEFKPNKEKPSYKQFRILVENCRNLTCVESISSTDKNCVFYDFHVAQNANYLAGKGGCTVVHNSGGGSVVPLLRAIAEAESIAGLPIVVIYTLPMNDEGAAAKANAVKTLERITAMVNDEVLSSLIIVDNAKIQERYPTSSIKDFWELANFDIVNHFNMFNTVSKCATNYDALDPMDFANIVSTGGCLIYGRVEVPVEKIDGQYQVNEKILTQALLRGTEEGTLAEGFNVKQAITMGVIVTSSEEILSQIPAVSINYAFNMLSEHVGDDCAMYRGLYVDDTASNTITVFTIFAGLGLPVQRINALKEQANQAQQKMDAKKKVKLSLTEDGSQKPIDPYAAMKQKNTSLGRMIDKRRGLR
jgi:cell division GTPase FtsZ/intein/homing endonuclease